jgi:hypothetical protein
MPSGNGDVAIVGGGTIWHVLVTAQTPGALAPLWWGPPGMGKTSMIERAAEWIRKTNGWSSDAFPLEVMIAATCDPTDFRGLPIPTPNGTRFEPPEEAVRLANAGRGWLFLDEIGNAVPAVQAALLRVVHKRVMGLLALPDTVKIIAAANPPEEAAGGWEQAAAFGNRWTHIVTTYADIADPSEWIEWLQHDASAADAFPVIDPDRWTAEYENAKAIISTFIRRNPGALTEKRNDYEGRFPLAFASRRSWETLARLHASCRCLGREDEVDTFARGTIGPAYAPQYAAFTRMVDLPDPEALLENPEAAEPDLRRPDRDYATVLAVCAAATRGLEKDKAADDQTMKRYVAAWKVIDRLMAAGKELVAVGANDYLVAKRPRGGLLHPDVRPVTAKLVPVLRGAGLIASA